MAFNDFNITGDYSNYDILEEEKETVLFNNNVWVKTKKKILRGRVMLITYGHIQRIVNI